MSDLDDIADSIGTITDEQDDDDFVRYAGSDAGSEIERRDVQVEYEGGFSNDH